MTNKKIIMIVALIAIVCVVAGAILTFNTTGYEKVEISSNKTSIEIPANNVRHIGNVEGVDVWKWDYGALAAYDAHQTNNSSGELTFHVIGEILKTADIEMVDGFKVYRLDAGQLNDFVGMDLDGKVYCISLVNETAHDKIMICSNDKHVATHVAQSVQYKD